MEVLEKAWRRASAQAVLKPKTPEPMMRMEEGGEKGDGDSAGRGEEKGEKELAEAMGKVKYQEVGRRK